MTDLSHDLPTAALYLQKISIYFLPPFLVFSQNNFFVVVKNKTEYLLMSYRAFFSTC